MTTLLELSGLDVSYFHRGRPPVRAVMGASLTVDAGEIVGLVGESGCGKSTLGRAAVGLVAPSAGEVRYRGEPVEIVSRSARPPRFRSLQMVFQDPYASLNPRRRVGRQIADAIRLGTGAKLDDEAASSRVVVLLERVGLSAAVAHRYPHEFSGGQRQRLCVARALALNPRFMVLDEPVSALDVSIQSQIINLLVELKQQYRLTYLFISHDLSVVEYISDRVAVMYLGEIVEMAASRELYQHPLHPYTQVLLSSIPTMEPSKRRPRIVLDGDVPSSMNPPAGCRFHPRCPLAMEICRRQAPRELNLDGHLVRCHAVEQAQSGG